jgi:hypothetical protein
VITNEGLGDISALVREHDLGLVIDDVIDPTALGPVPETERARLRGFATRHFSKAAYDTAYIHLLQAMNASA